MTKPIQILSVAIPIVTVIILACVNGPIIPLYCYMTILFGVPLLTFLVAIGISHSVNKSTEYLGAYVTRITYYEPWNEKVLRVKTVEDGRDNNGMIKYRTETYYETVYHPEEYEYETNIGKTGNITEGTFNHWKYILDDDEPRRIEMFRNYDTINGNAWQYSWNGDAYRMIPLTFKHRYFNPLKYSNSIFKGIKINDNTVSKYELVRYPEMANPLYQHCVVGKQDYSSWDTIVQRLNAQLGSQYQFRMFIIVFDGNKTSMEPTFQMQKAYWNQGNKNEFVLCIGVDPETNKLIWHNSFSWCKEPRLEAEVRNFLSSKQYFNCSELTSFIEDKVPTCWKRREFSEFKYLDTQLPNWANILILTLSIIATICAGLWCIC